MENKEKNTVQNVLIGMHVSIRKANNHSSEMLRGIVIDETKNTLTIETQGKRKRLIKTQFIFEFSGSNETMIIKGSDIVGRGEERIKKWLKKQRK